MFLRTEKLGQYIRMYPVTFSLIVIQILLWAVMEIVGSSEDTLTLLQFGALFHIDIVTPQWWRFITAMFLHIGFSHLLFNSFALYVFAPPLERMLGSWRYALFYILSGIIANLISYGLHADDFLAAGASGAIYGIYAAYLFLAWFRKDLIDQHSKKMITIIIVVGFLNSLIVPHVDLYGHLGGFIGGLFTIWLMTLFIRRRHKEESVQ